MERLLNSSLTIAGLHVRSTRDDRAKKEDRTPIVYVGLTDVREYHDLLQKAGWRAVPVDTQAPSPKTVVPSCLILDGSEFNGEDPVSRQTLGSFRPDVPVIFMVKDADVATIVRFMKAGAFDVLRRPVTDGCFVDTIRIALEHSDATLKQDLEVRQLSDRYASLSHRERQVMTLIVAGLLNKQVGGELGISEITVKAHRGSVMRKMNASSFAGLVRMAATMEFSRLV